MRLAFPEQRDAIQKSLREYGVPFDPATDKVVRKGYWDIQDIPAARQTNIEFFNTATSSEQAHTRLVFGCNLPNVGRLPGNTSFIVLALWIELLEVTTAAKTTDATRLAGYGAVRGFYVEDVVVLDERPLSRCMKRNAPDPVIAMDGGGAVGLAYFGVKPADDGLMLSVVDQVVIPVDQRFRCVVSHNGTADLSAAMSAKCSIWGWEITHGPKRS